MNQMSISLKIRVMIIIGLYPMYVFGAEKDSAPKGLRVVNQCTQNIEICYSFPLPNEYTTKSHGGSQLILQKQEQLLPLEADLLCIKIGELYTNHLPIEDKENSLLITESQHGNFIVYQQERRHILSLQQPKKVGFCSLQ